MAGACLLQQDFCPIQYFHIYVLSLIHPCHFVLTYLLVRQLTSSFFLGSFCLLACPARVPVCPLEILVLCLIKRLIPFIFSLSVRGNPVAISLHEPVHSSMLARTSASTRPTSIPRAPPTYFWMELTSAAGRPQLMISGDRCESGATAMGAFGLLWCGRDALCWTLH